MAIRGKRRVLLVPVGGVAAVMVLAATAWACTVWKGTLTVSGDRGGSVTSTGLRTGMVQRVSSGVTSASANGGWFKVSTGTDGCCYKLPWKKADGTVRNYEINFFNGEGYSDHTHFWTDCMTYDAGVKLADVRLNKGGQIASLLSGGTYQAVSQPLQVALPSGLAPNTTPQESAVCISDDTASYGNEAPITIL